MNEWIELNLPYYKFEDMKLNNPGTLIETENGIFLIGHINPMRGICDDCTEFTSDTIVKRYKVVWKRD